MFLILAGNNAFSESRLAPEGVIVTSVEQKLLQDQQNACGCLLLLGTLTPSQPTGIIYSPNVRLLVIHNMR